MKKLFSTNIGCNYSGYSGFKIQKGTSNLIATFGSETQVCIFDRHGTKRGDVLTQGQVVDLDWERSGQVLAIIDDQTHYVYIWEVHSLKTIKFSTHFKENLSTIAWSKVDERFAVGTSKGNMLICDWTTTKKYPVLGVHTRRISGVVWSFTGLLTTVGEDRVLSLSSIDGDLIKQVKLGGLPKDVSFAHTSLSKFGQSEDNAISCIVNQNQLLIWNFHEDTQPVSYTFDDSHGNAVAHAWQDTENIIVGFSEGSLALISMAGPGTGKELLRIREYGEGLLALAVSTKLQLLATASDEWYS